MQLDGSQQKKSNGRKENHNYSQESTNADPQEGTYHHSQEEMNNTAKALWVTGLVTAVLTAVIIADINESKRQLHQAVLDNTRQDAEIQHNSAAYDKLELRLLELMDLSISTNNTVIRLEEKLNSFESAEQ